MPPVDPCYISADDLKHHAKAALGWARTGLEMRRAYPSSGYTKSDLYARVNQARGVIAAVAIAEGRINHVTGADVTDPLWIEAKNLMKEIREA